MECKAIRKRQHIKSKEQAENFDDSKSDNSIKPEGPIEKTDSTQDFKKFITEFQAQVLGIGKGPAVQQNQYRQAYGNRYNNQQNLSQPSNEHANEVFTNLLMQTIPKCCDVVVKHKNAKKESDDQKLDGSLQEEERNQARMTNMLKPQNLKEALTTSKIQLKQEVIEKINGNSKDNKEEAKEIE